MSALQDAKAMLVKIRALTDDDGPESSMGAQWVLGQVQEILGGTSAHPRRASSAIWEEMLTKISRLQRERDHLQVEVARLRKIFDDAGNGEHNVLALVEHYQREAMEASTGLEDVIDQRDAFHARIDEIADALGDETEWSNLNDRGARALELAAELLAEVRRFRMQANPHPSGCHTEAPGSRDCDSDGHESCFSCSRRSERNEQVWRGGGIVEPPRSKP